MKKYKLLLILFTIFLANQCFIQPTSSITLNNNPSHISNLNISLESTKDFNKLKNLILNKKPTNVFIEEWLIYQSHTKDILKNLRKVTKKSNSKLYVVIGQNTWFGKKGAQIVVKAFKEYGKNVDGVVLRIEPNKTNIWENYGSESKAYILNQMLDGYALIQEEALKQKKEFIAEFPYWLADFQGPLRTFPQDACGLVQKISLLVDDEEKYSLLQDDWNDIFCNYYINLTKKANNKNEKDIKRIYNKFENELSYDSYFKGYIIDTDTELDIKELATSE